MATPTQSEVGAYAARGVSLRLASRTDVGLVRPNNEDTVVLGDLASGRSTLSSGRVGPAGVLFGVCDGMGGAAAGEVASRMAAHVILERLALAEIGAEAEAFRAALVAAVVQAGEAIRQHVVENPSREGMGTTCTVAAVRGGLLVVAQVGDSRAYLLRAGELRQLTRDQTWANEMLARGRVSPEEAAVMENGKAITQAVGTSEGLEVELESVVLCHGDRVLICSDGLSGMVPDREIQRAINEAEDVELASDELLRLALASGGRDNVSFVLCEFTGKVLGPALSIEQEYRLPVRRGHKRVAAAVVALVVLATVLWRAHENSGAGERGPAVAHAAQAAGPPVPSTVVASQRSQAVDVYVPTAAETESERSPRPVSGGAEEERASSPVKVDGAPNVRPQPSGSEVRRPVRQVPTKPILKIEKPQEEEIRIIRED